MAWTSGTANDYLDLLMIFRDYLQSNGYTILHSTDTQFYCKGPGLEELDEIYWGIDTFENPANNRYNWELAGSVSYVEGRGGMDHPGSSIYSGRQYIYLWNQAIPYWIAVNGRRAILLAKVGTVFQIAYLGLGLPLSLPEQYPYPLLIGGCGYTSSANYAGTGASNAVFCGTNISAQFDRTSQARALLPWGVWGAMSTNEGVSGQTVRNVVYNSPSYFRYAYHLTSNFAASVIPALDGSYLVEELVYMAWSTWPWTPMLKLDGVFKISGKNNSAENIVSVDGASYLVFPDVYRAGQADYFALKME